MEREKGAKMESGRVKKKNRVPIRALLQVASVAAGVQFGWALQLSLLTPYVQELGIPHQWASLIWLCGPISGMIVQPIVGHYSDSCTSRYGRRRPFIIAGAILVVIAVLIIGFSADVGFLLGDTPNSRPMAIVVFVLGFWVLDLANNTLQGPCRALLADFTGKDQTRNRKANAFFSLFMALGNIAGFATGAYADWYKVFPFTETKACDIACANLKAAFLLGVIVLLGTTFLSVTAASEIPYDPVGKHSIVKPETPLLTETSSNASGSSQNEEDEEEEEPEREALFWELFGALRDLPRPMWYILTVTALTWIAWFPFLLFDTDWMGREVYGGNPDGDIGSKWYYDGVHMGSLGLLLNSVVLGVSSLAIEFVCRKLGSSYVWGIANVIMAACFVGTALVTGAASRAREFAPNDGPPAYVVYSALAIFAVLGAPLAVTYSVPYSLTATYTEKMGGGQGLAAGVLNLAVVLPQVVVSLGSGPWDELFGGGNMPAFLLGAAAALFGGITAVLLLPRPPPSFRSKNRLRRARSSPIP
jgi:solute carrier family 45 protein 1/2/4